MEDIPVVTCPHFTDCSALNELRWQKQEQVNEAASTLHRRWGFELDAFKKGLADVQLQIATSRDHTMELRQAMETMAQQNQDTWKGVSGVLKDLTESIHETRRASEANHLSLLEVVTANASTAGRAVDQAHKAAVQADEAQQAAEVSRTKLGTMTKVVLTAWALTIGALGALVGVLMVHYGWPEIFGLIDKLNGKTP